jgi:signal transduction histidine kinase
VTEFDLRDVPLLSGLPDADLERIRTSTFACGLSTGNTLFREGDVADNAYVITGGELEILKESAGRPVRIAVSGEGDIVGEMGLISAEPRNATARALSDTTLLAIPKSCLDEVLATSAPANRALFDVFISRWREQEARVRQSEKMAQLGVLTAGLAHEMNNPAAAVTAGADRLSEALQRRMELAATLDPATPIPDPSEDGPPSSSIARADREEEIADVLGDLGVDEPWHHASILSDAGFVAAALRPMAMPASAVQIAALDAESKALIAEIGEGARRLGDLVAALKSYSFLDQAVVQEVDVIKGIEDTLLILRSKMRDVTVVREYQDVPKIMAFGSQLNQVWTNLLDNAIDAMNESGDPHRIVTIRAFREEASLVVEVENTGPPIPEDIIGRIFEAFFTTKEPGKGTGLGLDTSYNVIVTQHRGNLSVTSEHDATVFRVDLPIEGVAVAD